MKTKFTYLSLVTLCCLSINLSAQTFTGKSASSLIPGADIIRLNEKKKTPSFVKLDNVISVQANNHLQWLSQIVLKLNGEDKLKLLKQETDQIGFTHFRYEQYYRNLPVEYGVFYAHIQNGLLKSVNGEFYKDIDINTQPSLTKEKAFKLAVSESGGIVYKEATSGLLQMKNDGSLVVFPINNGFKLAYKFDIYCEEPLKRSYIYIDANTGAKLFEEQRIHHTDVPGSAVTAYNGTRTITTDSMNATSYRLQETGRGGGIITKDLNNGSNYATATDFIDSNNDWNTAGIDRYALDAHFGTEATYDFYFTKFGRNSYDNAGAPLFSYVHYGTSYVNAFWDGTQMTYGDGDGVDYNPLTSLDIVGHEITHGVTEHTAGLIYSDESGALNESFSDIFGITIDYFKNPLTANFLEGDQISVTGTPFRNLGNPNQYNNPDCYGGLFWNSPNEVHNNSGVQNYWYYLLSQGGSGTNDIGNSFIVNGIGFDDAIAICYRNLSVYLSPNSTYADARFFSIQAAIDLFGPCSNQVIQTTNAWQAVGVGGVFSNAVIAGFSAPQNFFCVLPATVNFANLSINGTGFHWDFGDGDTSLLAAPSHTYADTGMFTVTLIVTGTATCSNGDTLEITNFISVTDGGGPITASCIPVATSTLSSIGISRMQFNTIDNSSGTAIEGYKDFTCSNATTMIAGDPVTITLTTSAAYTENTKAWIDYDNNGIFNNSNELVFVSNAKLNLHSGIVHTLTNAVLNTALRMRVIDDISTNTITSACYNPQYGQAEDYTITLLANTQPPVANFIASTTVINVGGTVNFSDLSIHAPSTWQWTFTGGTPSTSSNQNPTVIYNTLGNYTVSLHVTNTFGADSIVKTNYIHVINSIDLCTGITSTTAPNGQLYDSGGPSGDYQDNEFCSLLIDPGCALSITLSFSQFSSESGYDYLRVYNGTSNTAPLILTANGNTLPAAVTANSGTMFIQWSTDGSVVDNGFVASWSSVIATGNLPVAAFNFSPNPPVLVPVPFTDQTSNQPNAWSWDFGDGQGSVQQNPAHVYSSSGTYVVTLIAFNCIGSDTIIQSVTVQAPPEITIAPDSLNVSLACNDSITLPFTIYNTGGGNLVININGISSDTTEILVFMHGADSAVEYTNTIAAINQNYQRYHLTKFYGFNPSALQTALQNKDVLLFPEQESQSNTIYSPLATVVQQFATDGGNIIILGSDGTWATRMYDMGLFTGAYVGYTSSTTLNVTDTTDAITDQVPLNFTSPSATFYHNITNADNNSLVQYNLKDVVAYRPIGNGFAVYLGFDFYNFLAPEARLLSNAVSLRSNTFSSWLSLNSTTDTISPGDSTVIYVTFNSAGLPGGNYQSQFIIHSNDSSENNLVVPCTLNISGPADIALSDASVDFGTIMQFTNATDSVIIFNNGCDTLRANLSVATSEFTFSPSVLNIASNTSAKVAILFAPSATGNFYDTLQIVNNDVDTVIFLHGAAGPAPVILTNPTAFNVSLNCNDSITLALQIFNTGGSDLIYTLNGGANGIIGDTSVLVIQESPSWGLNMSSFLQSNFNVTPTVISSSQITSTDFMLYDIVITVGGQSSAFYAAISSNVSQFEAFADAGGIIQYQMATQGTTININLAGGAVMTYGNLQNQNTGLLPTHPILAGLTNPLNGNSANHCYLSTVPAGAMVISETAIGAFPTTIEYNYGNGLVIATGMTWEWLHLNTSYNASPMLSNALSYITSKIGGTANWLAFNDITDTISPGDSTSINISFNSSGLNAGTYQSNIIINSNDPLNPTDTIPCTLTVSGPAEIALSDSCISFGLISQFNTTTDSIAIYNNGCDTLHVTNMTTTSGQFNVSPNSVDIAAGSIAMVAVTFAPVLIGNFADTLRISNNAGDTIICLSGSSGPPPVFGMVPGSINVTLNACDDSITVPVTIYNSGGSNLNYVVQGAGSGNAAPIQLLAFIYGADMSTEYPNTINGISHYFTNYQLTTISSTIASDLQNALINKEVLLFPEQETLSGTVYTGLASVVQDFVSNGGTVIVCGTSGSYLSRVYDLGLFTGSYDNYLSNNASMVVTDTTHIITDQLGLTMFSANATMLHDFTNVDAVHLVKYNTHDAVTYRTLGSGKIIYLGFDYFNSNNDADRLIANSVITARNGTLPQWLEISPVRDTIIPADSSIIYFTFNSNGLAGGVYTNNLVVTTNDPLHPVDTIRCTLNVTFNPCGDFSYIPPAACSGLVSFSDQSLNNPTSWNWQFGDGDSSTLQNPVHAYTAANTYPVQLIVCNGILCDTVIQSVTIASVFGPLTPSCTPIASSWCCDMGIQQVSLNTINNLSINGSAGYEDFTCTDSTTLILGQSYTMNVYTGNQYNESVLVWIDYNNNGIFAVSEQVLSVPNQLINHTGTITISNTAVINTPLRMRVGSEYYNGTFNNACQNLTYGQFEDYTIIVTPNNLPPVANFLFNIINTCTGSVQFTDISTNNPSSWAWDFNDGSPISNLQNPSHLFATPGLHIVTLTATNAFGSNTYTANVTVNTLSGTINVSGIVSAGQLLTFTGTAIGTGTPTYSWNMGDGFLSNANPVQHAYLNPNNYIVTLVITSGGCTITLHDTLSITVGISENSNLQSLLIYPNPFYNVLSISYTLQNNLPVSIGLFDIAGREIETLIKDRIQTVGNYKYELKNIPSGSYQLRITAGEEIKYYKVLKLD